MLTKKYIFTLIDLGFIRQSSPVIEVDIRERDDQQFIGWIGLRNVTTTLSLCDIYDLDAFIRYIQVYLANKLHNSISIEDYVNAYELPDD